MMNSPFSRLAATTRSGLVSIAAQSWAGVKTFASVIVASAGIQVGSLFNTNGTGAADVGVKVGVTPPAASVNATAKLLTVCTGIGGTEVEHSYFTKDTLYLGGNGLWALVTDASGALNLRTGSAIVTQQLSGGVFRSGYGFDINPGFGAFLSVQLHVDGRVNQWGTDSSASPGAQTVARPIGKNAIAVAAASVVITNSLVTASSVVLITPHARDATCKEIIAVPAAGSFTVSGSANATAALPFSWEVKGML